MGAMNCLEGLGRARLTWLAWPVWLVWLAALTLASAALGACSEQQADTVAYSQAMDGPGVEDPAAGAPAPGVEDMGVPISPGPASPSTAGGAPDPTQGGTPAAVDAGAPDDAGLTDIADAGPSDPGGQPSTGTLPVPASLDGPGAYGILDVPNTGPGNQFRLFAPEPLGEGGLEHPVVAWSPGAGAFPEAYLTMLNTLASHGFVVLSYNSTAQGPNLVDAIDWLLAENDRADSVLFGKLDTDRIAAGGHSAGSLATYQMADDPRLTTTLHMSGGSFTPAQDVPRLRAPALMVCGDAGGDGLINGDLANPMCLADFEMANVPVFYGIVEGGGHTALNDAEATAGFGTPPDDPKKLLFIKAMVGWLRWQLAGDESLRGMFVGDDCGLCAPDSGYVVMQKNLD